MAARPDLSHRLANKISLYTIVLDFKGSTYITQVQASSYRAVLRIWANSLLPGVIRGMREASIRQLRAELADVEPVLLDGLQHAWCTSVLVRGRLALINFVRTCGQEDLVNQTHEQTCVG